MTSSAEPALSVSRWPHTFRALRHRNFRLFWSGQIVSQIGTWMQTIALSWLAYRLTNSAFMLGVVNVAALLPIVPVSLLAGVISDHFSRRNLIILADAVLTLQALAVAALTYFNVLQVWHLILLSFIQGAAAAVEQPARLAFVVDTVGKDDLSNAIALNSGVFNTARIVGPAIAGVTVAWIGEAGCFLANGLSYLAVIAALWAIRLPPQTVRRVREKMVVSMAGGFKFVWSNRVVRALMLISAISGFFIMSFVALATVFSDDVLKAGASGLGVLMAAVGAGALLGALAVARLKTGHRGRWLTWSNLLAPAVLIAFCFSRSLLWSVPLVALVAAATAVRQILANSLIQIDTPVDHQGRVMSIFNLIFNGTGRVGVMAVGGLAEFIGMPWAVGLGAGISLLCGLAVILWMPFVDRLQ